MKNIMIFVATLFTAFNAFAAEPTAESYFEIRVEVQLLPIASSGESKDLAVANLVKMCDVVRKINFNSGSALVEIQNTLSSAQRSDGLYYIQGNCAIAGKRPVVEQAYLAPLGTELMDMGEDNFVMMGTISHTQIQEILGQGK